MVAPDLPTKQQAMCPHTSMARIALSTTRDSEA